MSFETIPRIGDWYKNTMGESFEIVAQDDDDETLELQYYDGTVEELDRETWETMHAEPIEPPEDWIGSMDVPAEDYQRADIRAQTEDWMTELELMDSKLS
ncbi:DUF6763 family protein [Thiogranum longum]|jgi:hypothetical protein